ncbi:MAG: translocation/assembly module TamB domain-containing protein [Rhodothermales bacterium]|nr:translocation/assembly module TamB domain-containing protein [Rhodothermales bacterium]MBO6781361.1 translocation/assembly module TamB domain-containing protein [Rhodothermales bacterium]
MAAPLKHISRNTAGAIGAVLLLLVVAFFAATRTEIGREQVARQIEAQFSRSTEASLQIGRLTGNLAQQFTAIDVRVRDAGGMDLLQVDTIRVRPSWEDLLRRRLDTRRVELINPSLRLAVDSVGATGWSDVFPRRPDSARTGASAWDFRSARLLARGGRIVSGEAVTLAENLSFDTRIEQSEGRYLIELLAASGLGREPALDVLGASGQAVVDSSRITVNQAILQTAGSDVQFSGFVERTDRPEFRVALEPSRVSFDELSGFVTSSPLRGSAELTLSASGTLDDFVISELGLSSGGSRVALSGTVSGLPTVALADMELEATPLLRSDLERIAPSLLLPDRLLVDSLAAEVFVNGRLQLEGALAGRSDVRLVAATEAGSASFDGEFRLAPGFDELDSAAPRLAGSDTYLRVQGLLETTSLDTGQLYLTGGGDALLNTITTLDGVLALESARTSGTLTASMRDSRIGPVFADVVRLQSSWNPGGGSATTRLIQPAGAMTADMAWQASGALELDAQLDDVDLGALLGRDGLSTSLNGELVAQIDDRSRLLGTVSARVDSSRITNPRGETHALPQQVRLRSALEDTLYVLTLDGTGAAGRVVLGDSPDHALQALQFWGRALTDGLRREQQKPYDRSGGLASVDDVTASLLREPLLGTEPLQSFGSLTISDLSRPASLVPGIPAVAGTAELGLRLNADANHIDSQLTLLSDSLRWGRYGLRSGEATLALETRYDGQVEENLILSLDVRSDTVTAGVTAVPDWHLAVDLAQRRGRVTMRAGRGSDIGPFVVSADTRLRDDRTRLRLDTLQVEARQLNWSLQSPAVIDLFNDAVAVDNLTITERLGSQRLTLAGTISPAPGDTLSVTARSLRLAELTEFASLRRQLGGLLSADVRITGGFDRPLTTGTVRVPAFIMDDRQLGSVFIRTDIPPGSEEIRLDLRIAPTPTPASVAPVSEVIDNRLTVAGTVRPPSEGDPGNWDLAIDGERIDLFFLKYIFNESVDRFTGFAYGGGTMTGAFGSPTVNARLDVDRVDFGIPLIGIDYSMEGSVRIDRDAIHFERVLLTDENGGTADLAGPMYFNDYRFFSFDVSGTLEDLLVMNRGETPELPFYGFIKGTGSATLTGPLTNATLRIPDGRTSEDSQLFIPIVEAIEEGDASFIIFADSTGQLPDLERLIRRPFVLARRASAERQFLDGLDMDMNIQAPRGSLIHLVIDPLLGDVINAESTGRVQIRRNQGEFLVFGQMEVLGGDYLFTAGEVFVRRFIIQPGGTLSWVGDPINARMNLSALYRTRASTTGLDDVNLGGALIPLVVELSITGLVASPQVDLGLSIDRSNQNALGDYQALEARLNQPDRATEYATSVLLTNSFQLTTDNLSAGAGEQLAFNSVSQLVSSQLSRFLDAALPNVDFNFGLQGERAEDLDITYGVALRLLDERLIIRGEGVYQGSSTDNTRANTQGIQGEFVVEVRLSPAVSAQVFFRREGDILQNADLTNTAGAGLTYQTDFPSWRRVLRRWLGRDDPPPENVASGEDS